MARFSVARWRFTFHSKFSDQIEIDLKSINQAFQKFEKVLENKNAYSGFWKNPKPFVNLAFNIQLRPFVCYLIN